MRKAIAILAALVLLGGATVASAAGLGYHTVTVYGPLPATWVPVAVQAPHVQAATCKAGARVVIPNGYGFIGYSLDTIPTGPGSYSVNTGIHEVDVFTVVPSPPAPQVQGQTVWQLNIAPPPSHC